MTALLTDNLPLLAGAPNGIKKLRELILELAVRGKLVPQDPNDEPASELLERIAEEKARLVAEGKIKKQKPLAEVGEEAEPFELPVGWRWSSLAQVAFVNPRNAAADSLEVSFVPMTFIGTRFDDQHGQEPRLWSEVKKSFTHFAEGDIGVAKITPCFENSKACVFSNLLNGLGAGTTELHIVRPIRGTLDPRYVLAYLKSPQFLLVGETKMTGTAGQKRLPKDFVEANPFPLPPLAEQHRIVAKVDELMALCDRLEAQQADADSAHAQLVQALLDSLTQASDADDFAQSWQRLAEHFHTLFTTESSIDALKQTLLQLAVMGKLVPQDPSDEAVSELLIPAKNEKQPPVSPDPHQKTSQQSKPSFDEVPFKLPTSWKWHYVGDLVSIKHGFAFSSTYFCESVSQHVLTTPGNFFEEGGFRDRGERTKYYRGPVEQDFVLSPGDLIVAMTEQAAGLLGSAAFIPNDGKTYLHNQRLGKLLFSHEMLLPKYLFYYFNGALLRSSVAESSTGMKVKHTSPRKIGASLIPVPPIPEQHRIVAKVDQLIALCDQLKNSLTQARQLHEQLANTLVEQAVT